MSPACVAAWLAGHRRKTQALLRTGSGMGESPRAESATGAARVAESRSRERWEQPVHEPVVTPRVIRFGVFEADGRARELRKQGRRIRLQEQPFQILWLLLERAGDVVTREELRQRLWPSSIHVDFDHGLNNAVARLRDALDDAAGTPRFIETLPRLGYRFIYPLANDVRAIATPDVQAIVTPPPPSESSDGWFTRRRALILGSLVLLMVMAAVTSVWLVRGPADERRTAQAPKEAS